MANYWVDFDGSNGDGTSGNPWNSFGPIPKPLNPGDQVIVSGSGDFSEWPGDWTAASWGSGTSGNPIIFKSLDPQNPATFEGTGSKNFSMDYVRFEDFRFQRVGQMGIGDSDHIATGLNFKRCTWQYTARQSDSSTNSPIATVFRVLKHRDLLMEDCNWLDLRTNNPEDNLDGTKGPSPTECFGMLFATNGNGANGAEGKAERPTIRGCTFRQICGDGIQVGGANGVTDMLVENCTFEIERDPSNDWAIYRDNQGEDYNGGANPSFDSSQAPNDIEIEQNCGENGIDVKGIKRLTVRNCNFKGFRPSLGSDYSGDRIERQDCSGAPAGSALRFGSPSTSYAQGKIIIERCTFEDNWQGITLDGAYDDPEIRNTLFKPQPRRVTPGGPDFTWRGNNVKKCAHIAIAGKPNGVKIYNNTFEIGQWEGEGDHWTIFSENSGGMGSDYVFVNNLFVDGQIGGESFSFPTNCTSTHNYWGPSGAPAGGWEDAGTDVTDVPVLDSNYTPDSNWLGINAGDGAYEVVDGDTLKDTYGNPWVGGIDIGAVEFQTQTPVVPGSELYVLEGNTGGVGTELDPYETIALAEAAAGPGSTIYIMNGTYDFPASWDANGASGDTLRITNYQGSAPVINVPASASVNADYLEFSNLIFEASEVITFGDGGFTMVGPVDFTNCIFRHSVAGATGAVQIDKGPNYNFTDCVFENIRARQTTECSALTLLGTSQIGTVNVVDCDFIDIGGKGIYAPDTALFTELNINAGTRFIINRAPYSYRDETGASATAPVAVDAADFTCGEAGIAILSGTTVNIEDCVFAGYRPASEHEGGPVQDVAAVDPYEIGKEGAAIFLSGNAGDVNVDKILVLDCYTGIFVDESVNLTGPIRSVMVSASTTPYGTGRKAAFIRFNDDDDAGSTRLVENNLFWEQNPDLANTKFSNLFHYRRWDNNPVGTHTYRNNIFVGCRFDFGSWDPYDALNDMAGLTVENNCWYNMIDVVPDSFINQATDVFGDPVLGADYVPVDLTSSVVEKGKEDGLSSTTDFYGNPVSGIVDIGAGEYQGSAPPPVDPTDPVLRLKKPDGTFHTVSSGNGSGDMQSDIYDIYNKGVDAFSMANFVEGPDAFILRADDRTKLDGLGSKVGVPFPYKSEPTTPGLIISFGQSNIGGKYTGTYNPPKAGGPRPNIKFWQGSDGNYETADGDATWVDYDPDQADLATVTGDDRGMGYIGLQRGSLAADMAEELVAQDPQRTWYILQIYRDGTSIDYWRPSTASGFPANEEMNVFNDEMMQEVLADLQATWPEITCADIFIWGQGDADFGAKTNDEYVDAFKEYYDDCVDKGWVDPDKTKTLLLESSQIYHAAGLNTGALFFQHQVNAKTDSSVILIPSDSFTITVGDPGVHFDAESFLKFGKLAADAASGLATPTIEKSITNADKPQDFHSQIMFGMDTMYPYNLPVESGVSFVEHSMTEYSPTISLGVDYDLFNQAATLSRFSWDYPLDDVDVSAPSTLIKLSGEHTLLMDAVDKNAAGDYTYDHGGFGGAISLRPMLTIPEGVVPGGYRAMDATFGIFVDNDAGLTVASGDSKMHHYTLSHNLACMKTGSTWNTGDLENIKIDLSGANKFVIAKNALGDTVVPSRTGIVFNDYWSSTESALFTNLDVTRQSAMHIKHLSRATHNTALVIGGTAIPDGNYAIYQDDDNNYPVRWNGGQSVAVLDTTDTTINLDTSHFYVRCAAATSITVNLPLSTSVPTGQRYEVRRAWAGAVTLGVTGADTINDDMSTKGIGTTAIITNVGGGIWETTFNTA
jgi:hypothetical protein